MWVPTHVYIHNKETKTFLKVYTESTCYFFLLYMCLFGGTHNCGGYRAALGGLLSHFPPCVKIPFIYSFAYLVCVHMPAHSYMQTHALVGGLMRQGLSLLPNSLIRRGCLPACSGDPPVLSPASWMSSSCPHAWLSHVGSREPSSQPHCFALST